DKARILWFGDSMIEGDMITQHVRDSLQKIFRGKGIGYVPLTSPISGFRMTIRNNFSDNWKRFDYVHHDNPKFPLSINGKYHYVEYDSSSSKQIHQKLKVSFKGGYKFKKVRILPNPQLLYGPRIKGENYKDTSNYFVFNNDTFRLKGNSNMNSIHLSSKSHTKVNCEFFCKPDQALYGMTFNSDTGVFLDNFSSRGNSGMLLAGIPKNTYRRYKQIAGADLIILQYGVNVSTPGVTNYEWYARSMTRVVEHLNEALPNVPIIIVSMADRATKKNKEMTTDTSVYAINSELKAVANKTKAVYFNLFKKMGGKNSIKKWVEEKNPALANKDYTHLNFRGSKKVANFFIEFLMKRYKKFKSNEVQSNI
ncbi:MAG: hypothetical protein ABEH43_07315, partial [Flavobacteriales bacterium]